MRRMLLEQNMHNELRCKHSSRGCPEQSQNLVGRTQKCNLDGLMASLNMLKHMFGTARGLDLQVADFSAGAVFVWLENNNYFE